MQISLKVNDQEEKELRQLQELLHKTDAYGSDSQAYKEAVRLAILFLNKNIPVFMLYERLFVNERQKLYKP